jgi:hypothetical protein
LASTQAELQNQTLALKEAHESIDELKRIRKSRTKLLEENITSISQTVSKMQKRSIAASINEGDYEAIEFLKAFAPVFQENGWTVIPAVDWLEKAEFSIVFEGITILTSEDPVPDDISNLVTKLKHIGIITQTVHLSSYMNQPYNDREVLRLHIGSYGVAKQKNLYG